MVTEIRPFTEKTFEDAVSVTTAAYGHDMSNLLRKILNNPIRRICSFDSAGDIVYQDGCPMGFQAAILRRLYFGKMSFVGTVGSTLGIRQGTSPALLYLLMKKTLEPRAGSKLFYANTANVKSMKLNRMLGVDGRGGESWERCLFAIIRPFKLAALCCRHKILRQYSIRKDDIIPLMPMSVKTSGGMIIERALDIEVRQFSDFWAQCLAFNRGLMSSRTGEEVDWMYGENMRAGKCVMLVARRDGSIVGYAVLRPIGDQRWRLMDVISKKDDGQIIRGLLSVAKKFLHRNTDAITLESRGFSSSAMTVISKELPFQRKIGHNSFLWKFTDEEMMSKVRESMTRETGWFFGPYDGDACL